MEEKNKKGKQLKSLPMTFIKPPHGAYKTGMAQSKKKRWENCNQMCDIDVPLKNLLMILSSV